MAIPLCLGAQYGREDILRHAVSQWARDNFTTLRESYCSSEKTGAQATITWSCQSEETATGSCGIVECCLSIKAWQDEEDGSWQISEFWDQHMDLASLDSWTSPHTNSVLSAVQAGQLGYLGYGVDNAETSVSVRSPLGLSTTALNPSHVDHYNARKGKSSDTPCTSCRISQETQSNKFSPFVSSLQEGVDRPPLDVLASQAAHRAREDEEDGLFIGRSHGQEGQIHAPTSIDRTTTRPSTPIPLSAQAARSESPSSPLTPLPTSDDESDVTEKSQARLAQLAIRRTTGSSRTILAQFRRSSRIYSTSFLVAQDRFKMSSTSEEAKKDKVGASTTSKRKRQHSRRTELDIRATVSKKKDGSRDLMKEKRQDKHRQKKARQNRLKASKWKLPQSFGHNDCDDSDFRSVDDSEEEKEVVKAYDLGINKRLATFSTVVSLYSRPEDNVHPDTGSEEDYEEMRRSASPVHRVPTHSAKWCAHSFPTKRRRSANRASTEQSAQGSNPSQASSTYGSTVYAPAPQSPPTLDSAAAVEIDHTSPPSSPNCQTSRNSSGKEPNQKQDDGTPSTLPAQSIAGPFSLATSTRSILSPFDTNLPDQIEAPQIDNDTMHKRSEISKAAPMRYQSILDGFGITSPSSTRPATSPNVVVPNPPSPFRPAQVPSTSLSIPFILTNLHSNTAPAPMRSISIPPILVSLSQRAGKETGGRDLLSQSNDTNPTTQ